jgi:hypothetical protein
MSLCVIVLSVAAAIISSVLLMFSFFDRALTRFDCKARRELCFTFHWKICRDSAPKPPIAVPGSLKSFVAFPTLHLCELATPPCDTSMGCNTILCWRCHRCYPLEDGSRLNSRSLGIYARMDGRSNVSTHNIALARRPTTCQNPSTHQRSSIRRKQVPCDTNTVMSFEKLVHVHLTLHPRSQCSLPLRQRLGVRTPVPSL